jgi:hypothetical protein
MAQQQYQMQQIYQGGPPNSRGMMPMMNAGVTGLGARYGHGFTGPAAAHPLGNAAFLLTGGPQQRSPFGGTVPPSDLQSGLDPNESSGMNPAGQVNPDATKYNPVNRKSG